MTVEIPGCLVFLFAVVGFLFAAFDENGGDAVAVHGGDGEAEGTSFGAVADGGDAAETLGDETADRFGVELAKLLAVEIEPVEEIENRDATVDLQMAVVGLVERLIAGVELIRDFTDQLFDQVLERD